MDISQIWKPVLFVIVPALAAWAILKFARRLRNKLIRRTVKVGASALFIVSSMLLAIILLTEVACSVFVPPLYSPDGKHVAIVDYVGQGALGADYATVQVRWRWSPFAETAYDGLGSWDFVDKKLRNPEVKWLDDTHLSIRYYDDPIDNDGRGVQATCRNQIGKVRILCKHLQR